MGKMYSFTIRYPELTSSIITTASVAYNGNVKAVNRALWDTGATVTCVSRDIVQSLGMIPTGRQAVNTPSGEAVFNTYLVDVCLPNNVFLKDVKVCDSAIGRHGLDMLIGTNIIFQGEFYTSSFGGTATFSFRIPAKQEADFIKYDRYVKFIGPLHGKGKRKK